MARPKKIVKVQKLQDRYSKKKYWDWVNTHPGPNGNSDNELTAANPDILSEDSGKLYDRGPNVKRCMKVMDARVNLKSL